MTPGHLRRFAIEPECINGAALALRDPSLARLGRQVEVDAVGLLDFDDPVLAVIAAPGLVVELNTGEIAWIGQGLKRRGPGAGHRDLGGRCRRQQEEGQRDKDPACGGNGKHREVLSFKLESRAGHPGGQVQGALLAYRPASSAGGKAGAVRGGSEGPTLGPGRQRRRP